MKLLKFLLVFFSLSFILSCSKGDDEDDNSSKTISLPLLKTNEFTISIQTDTLYDSFYNVEKAETSKDTNCDFDFTIIRTKIDTTYKYVIGSAGSSMVKNIYGNQCDNIVLFYEPSDNFIYSCFDTMKTVTGLKDKIKTWKYVTNDVLTAKDYVVSDQYGWSSHTMFGFKLKKTDKVGVICIKRIDYKIGAFSIIIKYE